jgi:hypothetical protein
MTHAPSDPETFFCSYLPERFAEVRAVAGGPSSVGSLLFRISGAGEWSLRLRDGDLEVTRGAEDDVMLQITVPHEDFDALVVQPIERVRQRATAHAPRGAALRVLAADPETARLVRHVPGSLLFVFRDGDVAHHLLVTPGRRAAEMDKAACTIECKMADLIAAEAGGASPMQLFTSGKLRITGNLQIAMALAGILA